MNDRILEVVKDICKLEVNLPAPRRRMLVVRRTRRPRCGAGAFAACFLLKATTVPQLRDLQNTTVGIIIVLVIILIVNFCFTSYKVNVKTKVTRILRTRKMASTQIN